MTWQNWADQVALAIEDVPDDLLRRAAEEVLQADLVITAGNGGSASLASHAAQAIVKPDYAAGGGRAAVCLTDLTPILTAHANDGGWENALVETAKPYLDAVPGCLLFLISSSGKSENVVRLARLAVERELPIVAMTGFQGEPLRSFAKISLHVNSHDYETVEPAHDALIHRMQYHLRALGKH